MRRETFADALKETKFETIKIKLSADTDFEVSGVEILLDHGKGGNYSTIEATRYYLVVFC